MKNSRRNRLRAEKKADYTKRGTEQRLSKYERKRRGVVEFHWELSPKDAADAVRRLNAAIEADQ